MDEQTPTERGPVTAIRCGERGPSGTSCTVQPHAADLPHYDAAEDAHWWFCCPSCDGHAHQVVDGDRTWLECTHGCGYSTEGRSP